MNESSNDPSLQMPKRTTPTWEIELLISGATAFGLVQLLSFSDDGFLRLQLALNNAELLRILTPLQIYVRIALICLIVAILLHLVVRAYWVGLIGLHSVYRGPPDLSKIQSGPYSRRAMEADTQDVPASIDRADNLATRIFGFGIGMALMMLIPTIFVLIMLGVAAALDLFYPSTKAVNVALLGLTPILVLFLTLPSFIDLWIGARIKPASWMGRYLTWHLNALKSFYLGMGNNMLVLYMMARGGSFRGVMISSVFVGFAMSMVAVIGMPRLKAMQDRTDVSHEWEASDYASERGTDMTFARRAYIEAPQLRGDFLSLSVPVPNKSPSGGYGPCLKDQKAKDFVACLEKGLALTIDGKSVEADWLLMPARSGRPPTLRALIDVRDQARGKHVLRIDYPFNREHPDDAWVEIIHFWK